MSTELPVKEGEPWNRDLNLRKETSMCCSLIKDIRQLRGLKQLLYMLGQKGSQHGWRGVREQCMHWKTERQLREARSTGMWKLLKKGRNLGFILSSTASH